MLFSRPNRRTRRRVKAHRTDAITANMEQMGIASADYAAYVADRGSFGGLTSDAERLERIIE